jgi:hypothetical protein
MPQSASIAVAHHLADERRRLPGSSSSPAAWTTLPGVFNVDASSGTPLFTDGPFVESKEHLGGFAVVDVADEEAARLWGGKDRGGLWLAAGGATFPGPHATSGDFITESVGCHANTGMRGPVLHPGRSAGSRRRRVHAAMQPQAR